MSFGPISFSIIIPTWNRCAALTEILISIVSQQYKSSLLEIIVVDSFSDDGTSDVIENFSKKNPEYCFKYLNVDINAPSYKRNIGLNNATLDWAIFLDDDCVLSECYFESCIYSLLTVSDSRAIFFGEVRYPPELVEKSNYNRYRDSRHFSTTKKSIATSFIKITTMNMMCNILELRGSGILFDPDYKFSCEDTDFGYRLANAGFKFFTSNAVVYHYESCKDITTYLEKCKRVYLEGYSLVQKKDPVLATKMIWKYFSPIRNELRGEIHYLILRVIFYKRMGHALARILQNMDSNRFFYSEKLFMYVIMCAYVEGLDR